MSNTKSVFLTSSIFFFVFNIIKIQSSAFADKSLLLDRPLNKQLDRQSNNDYFYYPLQIVRRRLVEDGEGGLKDDYDMKAEMENNLRGGGVDGTDGRMMEDMGLIREDGDVIVGGSLPTKEDLAVKVDNERRAKRYLKFGKRYMRFGKSG